MIAYINGTFIEEEKAVLQVSDLALLRGYAAFDFFRTKNGIPLFLDDYLTRFFQSIESLHLQPSQTKQEIKDSIYELILKNKMKESGIRMIITGGYSPDGYQPVLPNLVITEQAIQLPTTEKFEAGLKIITHEYQRDLPSVKSTNYLTGIWLQQKIKEQNATDVLYHQNNIISEFPRANVFIVTKKGMIATPVGGILKGITRMKILELLKDKRQVEERTIHLDEVKDAAEVFMTSTTKRILPISQVDDVVIGEGKAGPVATLLNKAFMEMEEQFVQQLTTA